MKADNSTGRSVRALLLGCILFSAGCSSAMSVSNDPEPQRGAGYRRPANLNDGWKVGTPGDAGLDSIPLINMVAAIQAGAYPGIHGVLVARRGTLVLERYFDGPDARLDGEPTTSSFGPDTLHDIRSVTKSVTGLLLGIAISRRLVPGVHTLVHEYFPEMPAGDGRRQMTVGHLLSMTSGIVDDDADSLDTTALDESDPVLATWASPLRHRPGAQFEYAGANTTLLRGVIERASGMPLDEFADAVLFQPLGIRSYEWMRWDDGSPRAAGGLRLRPRDMAKIGLLMTADGRWRGRQVVARDWVRQSAAVRATNEDGERYGYQWWIQNYTVRGRQHPAVVALGSGGQRILAFSGLDLVVVFTGGNYEDMAAARFPELLVATYVMKAVRETPRLHVSAPAGWTDMGAQPQPPDQP